jgi:hypothetical protein
MRAVEGLVVDSLMRGKEKERGALTPSLYADEMTTLSPLEASVTREEKRERIFDLSTLHHRP